MELLQIYIFRNFAKVQFDIKNELRRISPIFQLLSHLIAMEENLMEQSDWPKIISPSVELKVKTTDFISKHLIGLAKIYLSTVKKRIFAHLLMYLSMPLSF